VIFATFESVEYLAGDDFSKIGPEAGDAGVKNESGGVLEEADHHLLHQVFAFGVGEPLELAGGEDNTPVTAIGFVPGDGVTALQFSQKGFRRRRIFHRPTPAILSRT